MHLITNKILRWYNQGHRDLPWRNTNNPYKIWVSEIILQQTRVAQGTSYYERFINEFPDIFSLAQSSEEKVLKSWEGLGYYSRARNMIFTSKEIVTKFNGIFPNKYKELIKLKGIGSYTAAAIASFAFKECVPAIDGNVKRVLSRLEEVNIDIKSAQSQKYFQNLSYKFISNQSPDLYNQAMMELGALICIPKRPKCETCPLNEECLANLNQTTNQFPNKSLKIEVKERIINYISFRIDDEWLLKKRELKDIWNGLYDFYELKENDIELNLILANYIKKNELKITELEHILTHRRLKVKIFEIALNKDTYEKLFFAGKENLKFYSGDLLAKIPKPILIAKYIQTNTNCYGRSK